MTESPDVQAPLPEPEEGTAAPPPEAASPSARMSGPDARPWIVAGIAFLVAVVCAVLAVTSYVNAAALREEAAALRQREAARGSALEAGEVVALQITTVDGARIDQWVERTKSLATGQFEEDLVRGYDEALRAEFRSSRVRTVGEVIQSFVQKATTEEAVVFVIVRQTTARAGSAETIEDELRMEVTLRRSDGSWLASDVAVLTPTPPLTQPGGGG